MLRTVMSPGSYHSFRLAAAETRPMRIVKVRVHSPLYDDHRSYLLVQR